jgi:hypothetical protein
MAAVGAMRRRHLPDGGILSEARDVLHRAIHPALYRLICMAIKIASNLRVFS